MFFASRTREAVRSFVRSFVRSSVRPLVCLFCCRSLGMQIETTNSSNVHVQREPGQKLGLLRNRFESAGGLACFRLLRHSALSAFLRILSLTSIPSWYLCVHGVERVATRVSTGFRCSCCCVKRRHRGWRSMICVTFAALTRVIFPGMRYRHFLALREGDCCCCIAD